VRRHSNATCRTLMCASLIPATLRWRLTATKSHQRLGNFWSVQVSCRRGLHELVRSKISPLVTLWVVVGAPMTVGYYRRSEHGLCSNRSEQDLCGISLSKAAAAGPRPRDGVCGGGRGRPHSAAARQSHLVVPLAQRVAA